MHDSATDPPRGYPLPDDLVERLAAGAADKESVEGAGVAVDGAEAQSTRPTHADTIRARTFEITVEAARDAVVALTEMRGWVGAGSRRERDFLLPRIDRCIDAFGITDIVRDLHHQAIEGVEPDAR